MAHGITTTDNMFSVREEVWHKLVEPLADYPTLTEAKAIAHPWEPVSEPIYRRVPVIAEDGSLSHEYREVDDWQVNVRSDNGDDLGVTTSTYEPVSNQTMYDIAEVIQGEGAEVKLETGGSLNGGRKVWLLLRLNEPLEIKGDPNGATVAYYSLQNSHDGSGSFRGQAVNTRIVCANTSHAADLEAERRGTEVVFRHTSGIHDRITEAKQALAGWRDDVAKWRRSMEHLLTLRVTPEQAGYFIEDFIPVPVLSGKVSQRVLSNVEAARQDFRTILASPTTRDTAHTAYGLVAASVEYQQWARRVRAKDERGRNESRFRRAYLDRDRVVADAVKLAVAVAAN